MKKLYNDFSGYLKARYGEKVKRIPVDAGLFCPNRENNRPGCIYCLNGSASTGSDRRKPIKVQLQEQITAARSQKKPVRRFIAYFQAYTNTYAPPEALVDIFSPAASFPEITAIAIGTRPDCIDKEKILAIKRAAKDKDIWIELGLQSIQTRTLKFIRRGHSLQAFHEAAALIRKHGIKTGAHIILGFPWEKRKDILRTAAFLKTCHIDFIKIHLLHVLKNTPLEALYRQKKIILPSLPQYVHMTADLIEHLPRNIVIQRLTGEGTRITHLAPKWALEKTKVIEAINNELIRRRSFQGKYAG